MVLGSCKTCKVIENAESYRSELETTRIKQETRLLARYVQKLASHEEPHLELRAEAETELYKLHQRFEEKRREEEKRQGKKLDEATSSARELVEAALKELTANYELDKQVWRHVVLTPSRTCGASRFEWSSRELMDAKPHCVRFESRTRRCMICTRLWWLD
jgi:hypothetical protein